MILKRFLIFGNLSLDDSYKINSYKKKFVVEEGGDGVGGMAGWAFFFGGMAGSAFFFGGMAGLELLAGCDISNFIWRDGGISPFFRRDGGIGTRSGMRYIYGHKFGTKILTNL